MAERTRLASNSGVQETDPLTAELAQSRSELLKLAERVQRLIGKRSERQALLQQIHRSAGVGAPIARAMPAHYLCSVCATHFANLAIQNVRGATPGTTCDQCGDPALVWVQLKFAPETESAGGMAPQPIRA
jgi:hypothetical protein